MADELETKLSAARTRLILDRPFLGALALRMPMVAVDPEVCATIGTDARSFFYNPDYIRSLSLDQVQFVVAHEVLHCALSHFARREHRARNRWDVACDLAINPLLIREGLTPPPGALYDIGFEGMMAEEIYPCIEENPDQETHDDHFYDKDDSGQSGDRQGDSQSSLKPQEEGDSGSSAGESEGEGGGSKPDQSDDRHGDRQSSRKPQEEGGTGSNARESEGEGVGSKPEPEPESKPEPKPEPKPLNETEREQLAVMWRQRLAGAAQQALQAGKLGGSLARLVDHLLQPELPWRMMLARYMTAMSRDDYSYARPSRREGDAILPTLRSAQIDILVVVDTSGSVSDEEIREFLSEIDAIKGQVRARITLHACDAELAAGGPWVYEAWEEFSLPEGGLQGGGGTRFTPVFEWVDNQGLRPDLVVYFTDGMGEFPKREPACPVIWLIKGRGKVPWGQRIQLN